MKQDVFFHYRLFNSCAESSNSCTAPQWNTHLHQLTLKQWRCCINPWMRSGIRSNKKMKWSSRTCRRRLIKNPFASFCVIAPFLFFFLLLLLLLLLLSLSNHQKVAQNPQFLTLLTWKCASRHNGLHFFDIDWASDRPKVVRTWCVLALLTWKCAWRHNGVHFFDIATSKSRPNMVCFATFYFEMCFPPQRRALFRPRNVQKRSEHQVFCHFLLGNVLRATTGCTFSTSQLPKVVRTWCVLPLLTLKCASRHNGVHFFPIATSKSRPDLTCFDTFEFQMCFAPQRRALFPHLNFQKWSETDVFCHFWLQNVLRATTACKFYFLPCPDVSAPAALASLLFDPPEPQNTGETQCFATFLPFRAPASSLFWLSPSLSFCWAALHFHLSILSEV